MAAENTTAQPKRPEAYYFSRPDHSPDIQQLIFALDGVCKSLAAWDGETHNDDEVDRIANLHGAAAILSHQLMMRIDSKPTTKRQIESVRKYHQERFGPDWPNNAQVKAS